MCNVAWIDFMEASKESSPRPPRRESPARVVNHMTWPQARRLFRCQG